MSVCVYRSVAPACLCQEASAPKLARLQPQMRDKAYRVLVENEVQLPFVFQVAALGVHAHEILSAEATTDEDLTTLAKRFLPVFAEEANFDLFSPQYAHMDESVGKADRGATLSRTVAETCLPLITTGKPTSGRLHSWASALVNEFQSLSVSCPILQAAKSEIVSMASSLKIVTGGAEDSIEPLNVVMSSKAGSKATLKTALMQSSYYRAEVSELRSTWSSWLSLKPEIQKAEAGLRGDLAWDHVKPTVKALLTWRNSLRAGATASCEAALTKVFENRLLQVSSAKDDAGLTELIGELTICEKLPSDGTGMQADAYTSVRELAEQCLNTVRRDERRQRILSNFEEVAQRTMGTQSTESLDTLITFAETTQHNISELWSRRDQQDLDEEILAAAAGSIPLIAKAAATSLETAMLVVAAQAKEGKSEFEKLKKIVRVFTLALEELKDKTATQYVTVLNKHMKLLDACAAVRTMAVNTGNPSFLKNATMMATALTESSALPADAPDHQKAFQEVLLVTRKEGLKMQSAMQKEVGSTVVKSLENISQKLQPLVTELQEWKKDVPESEHTPWQKVVDSAASILGEKTTQLVQLFKTLKKEPGGPPSLAFMLQSPSPDHAWNFRHWHYLLCVGKGRSPISLSDLSDVAFPSLVIECLFDR